MKSGRSDNLPGLHELGLSRAEKEKIKAPPIAPTPAVELRTVRDRLQELSKAIQWQGFPRSGKTRSRYSEPDTHTG